jgi:hypothetical protein
MDMEQYTRPYGGVDDRSFRNGKGSRGAEGSSGAEGNKPQSSAANVRSAGKAPYFSVFWSVQMVFSRREFAKPVRAR